MRLLIAEDDPRLLKSLTHIFETNNYLVDAVSTGTEALAYAETAEYDGLVLDIMMPGMDGLAVLKQLRNAGISTPALFLSAKSEVEQRVEGLDAGADDYLPKPFSMKELLARIRAMTRRQTDTTDNVLAFGDIALNRSTYQLTGPENPEGIRLAGKEYQMLEMLMSNPGQVISPDLFMDKIWGYDSEAEQNVVWVYVSYLRKKLTSIGSQVKIRAARGLGYSLEKDNA